jgi:hypothetical protein
MNLIPFEPVGWLLLVAALLFTSVSLASVTRRPLWSGCASLCLVAAAVYLDARGDQLSRHSPVIVIQGVITDVGHIHNKGGNPFETIQVRLDQGQLAPPFDTHGLGIAGGQPPLHIGDRLRASFYTWNDSGFEREPYAIDLLSGPNRGWAYRAPPNGWALTWITSILALAFFSFSLYRTYRRRPATHPLQTTR